MIIFIVVVIIIINIIINIIIIAVTVTITPNQCNCCPYHTNTCLFWGWSLFSYPCTFTYTYISDQFLQWPAVSFSSIESNTYVFTQWLFRKDLQLYVKKKKTLSKH